MQKNAEPSRMQATLLFGTTAVVFLVLDAVMLKVVMRPLFEQHLGNWLLQEIRFGPAVAFYLFYIAGLVWLVSLPAMDWEPTIAAVCHEVEELVRLIELEDPVGLGFAARNHIFMSRSRIVAALKMQGVYSE